MVKTPVSASFLSHGFACSKISLRNFQLAENKGKVTENTNGDNICSSWSKLLRGMNFLGSTGSRESKTGRKVQSHQGESLHFSGTETKPRE